jgi:hypothetical protein
LTSDGGSDAFVAKLDPSGNFLWVRQIGGTSSDEGWTVTVDGSGNVYATGYFTGEASLGNGVTVTSYSPGGQDAYVAKLDNSGNALWAKDIGGTGSAWGFGIATDPSGYVYATG